MEQALQQGLALQQSGQVQEALAIYEQILTADPGQANALFLGGTAKLQLGENKQAAQLLDQACTATPDNSDAWNNLGLARAALGENDFAATAHRRATLIDPANPLAWGNLGIVLLRLDEREEAETALRQAIELSPGYAKAYMTLGNLLQKNGRAKDSEDAYRKALEIEPDNPDTLNNLAGLYLRKGRTEECEALCRQILAANPDHCDSLINLGVCLKSRNRLSQARTILEKALKIKPQDHEGLNNMGIVLKELGDIPGSIRAYRKALEGKPDFAPAFGNLIFALEYDPEISGETLLNECHNWHRQHSAPLTIAALPHGNSPAPERRLKIGYVSPDFREHAVAYLLEPLFASHDHAAFEIYAYAELEYHDQTTERFRAHVDHWRETLGIDDETLASQIRKDEIDILIDCGGYTASNRLMVFAHKPAPIQVATLNGHGVTTGMPAMDYIQVDPYVAPEGYEKFFSEKIIHLQHSMAAFGPNKSWPKVSSRTPDPKGTVFACLAAPARSCVLIRKLWQRILDEAPDSRLLLKNQAFNVIEDMDYWREYFSDIDLSRVDFEGIPGGWGKNMDVYERIDVVLDSFPMTGGTTTAIPLWMGVPVITLAGAHPGQRFGASFLSAAGFPELVADDTDSYVAKAITLAGDKASLSQMRINMRQRMANSNLCDALAITRDIEATYRKMWKDWCATTPR